MALPKKVAVRPRVIPAPKASIKPPAEKFAHGTILVDHEGLADMALEYYRNPNPKPFKKLDLIYRPDQVEISKSLLHWTSEGDKRVAMWSAIDEKRIKQAKIELIELIDAWVDDGPSIAVLMLKYGVFIAGGSLMAILTGQRVNDIDFFFKEEKTPAEMEEVGRQLAIALGGFCVYFTENALTIALAEDYDDYDGGTRNGAILNQLVTRKAHGLSGVLGSFDLWSCQIAFDGVDLYATDAWHYAITTGIQPVLPWFCWKTTADRFAKYLQKYNIGYALVGLNASVPLPFRFGAMVVTEKGIHSSGSGSEYYGPANMNYGQLQIIKNVNLGSLRSRGKYAVGVVRSENYENPDWSSVAEFPADKLYGMVHTWTEKYGAFNIRSLRTALGEDLTDRIIDLMMPKRRSGRKPLKSREALEELGIPEPTPAPIPVVTISEEIHPNLSFYDLYGGHCVWPEGHTLNRRPRAETAEPTWEEVEVRMEA